jgi:hypothetical protein
VSSVVDKESDSRDEAVHAKDEEVIEDESNYASGLRLGLIVTGLTLSVLLVALVRLGPDSRWAVLTNPSGPSHFSNRNSNHHHRLQFYPRCGVVWKRFSHCHLCSSTAIGKTLSALLVEMVLFVFSRLIRTGEFDMRSLPILENAHCRESCGWYGCCWSFLWRS